MSKTIKPEFVIHNLPFMLVGVVDVVGTLDVAAVLMVVGPGMSMGSNDHVSPGIISCMASTRELL